MTIINNHEVCSITTDDRKIRSVILPDSSLYEVGINSNVSEIVPFAEFGSIWFLIYRSEQIYPFVRLEGSGAIVTYF